MRKYIQLKCRKRHRNDLKGPTDAFFPVNQGLLSEWEINPRGTDLYSNLCVLN